MKRVLKIGLVGFLVLMLAASIGATWYLSRALPIGTGYVAKYLCSSVFISLREPGPVFAEDIAPVNPLARVIRYRIDHEAQSVSAEAFGRFSKTAVYREGCGCTLVAGTTAATLEAQSLLPPAFNRFRPVHTADRAWPEGEGPSEDPADFGVDAVRLEAALAAAFHTPDPDKPLQTRAVLVVYNGRLIAERYADGIHQAMPLLGWSMAKSITNALVGILVQKGRLDLRQPAPVPEWQAAGDPRMGITIDQLLRMSSGLAFEEVYAPLKDATAMLYGSADFAAYAAAKLLEREPDTHWNYSSGTANILARMVRQAVTADYPHYYQFIHQALFDKIGMYSAVLEPDASGTFVGSSYAFATARDWARFGLLYLQDGVWQGERILPQGWVAYTTTPTRGAPRGEYGAHFWLNAGAPDNSADRPWPGAPADAYAARGFQEQRVIVIPSRQLVLVRLGATADRRAWDSNQFIQDVIAALP